jgi:hypothetical protein
MPAIDHPMLIIIAGAGCVAAAIPLARFFFDDFDTFREDLLGLILSTPTQYFKMIRFAGSLAFVFFALYSLALRVVGAP